MGGLLSLGKIDVNHSYKLGKKSSHNSDTHLSGTCLLSSSHNPHPLCQQMPSVLPSELSRSRLPPPACAAPTQAQVIIISHCGTTTPCHLVSSWSKHVSSTQSLELLLQNVKSVLSYHCSKPCRDASVAPSKIKVLTVTENTLCNPFNPLAPYPVLTTLPLGYSATTRLSSGLTLQEAR